MVCMILRRHQRLSADSDRVCGPEGRKKAHFRFRFTSQSTARVVILRAYDYELDLTEGGFASLFANFTRAMLPDITRSVHWVFIHSDLITRAANDVLPDVLYSLSTIDRQVSYSCNALFLSCSSWCLPHTACNNYYLAKRLK